ncbi:uncharacterized protein LOC143032995 [Oratosquilla oratoria]|uniref:uncharacterized protein LOC143032995 n=1 Tax=Oratosquilla oratoria TaxID=337810 RepID=UPI003F76D78B
MIVSISYMGNLIAFITVPAKSERIFTLLGLAESSLTPKMLDYGNFVPGALKTSQDKTHQAIGQRLILTQTYEESFHEVNTSITAFVEGNEYLQYLVIKYRVANSYYLPEVLYPIHIAFIYPKKTPWKHKFDPYLQSLVESGLFRYWKQIFLTELRKKYGVKIEAKKKQVPRALSLIDMQGAFFIYGMGLAVSAIVIVSELLFRLAKN